MTQHVTVADEAFERRKIKIGIRMTLLYSLVYGGFVVLNVFQPTVMEARAVFGLNLAVAYGLGLIIIAFIFALIYNRLCRMPTQGITTPSSSNSGPQTQQQES
jgi:uncharacterized membrane protein (DUF485 family)